MKIEIKMNFGYISYYSIVLVTGFIIASHCDFVENRPHLNFDNMSRLETKDVLVGFEGCLEMPEETNRKRIYLHLVANSFETQAVSTGSEVLIKTGAGLVTLKTTTQGINYVIERIIVRFRDEDGLVKTCTTRLLDIPFRQSNHYSCKRAKTYLCFIESEYTNDKQVASIKFGLELELDRDQTKVTPFEYFKPASPCEPHTVRIKLC